MAGLVGFPATGRVEDDTSTYDNAIPVYQDPPTGQTFHKYDTSTGSATASEVLAIEYLCQYITDKDGDVWLVSEQGKAVARMTRLYVRFVISGLPNDVPPMEESYEYDGEAFRQLLQDIRSTPSLEEEARAWARSMTNTDRTPGRDE